MTPPVPHLRRPNPAIVCRAVLVTAVVCLGLVAPIAYYGWDWPGLGAAVAAALCCCGGALAALALARWFRGPDHLLASVLVGMSVRMGVALAAVLVVQLGGGPLAEAGFVYYLLMFYSVTLAAETVAVVRA